MCQCCGWKCSTFSPECSNIAICALLVRLWRFKWLSCSGLFKQKHSLKMYFNSDSECRKKKNKDNDFWNNSLHFLYFAYPVQGLNKLTLAALEILQIPFPTSLTDNNNIHLQWHLLFMLVRRMRSTLQLWLISVYIYNLSEFPFFFLFFSFGTT